MLKAERWVTTHYRYAPSNSLISYLSGNSRLSAEVPVLPVSLTAIHVCFGQNSFVLRAIVYRLIPIEHELFPRMNKTVLKTRNLQVATE